MNSQVKFDSSLDYSDLVAELRSGEDGLEYAAADALEALMARIEDIAELYNSARLTPVPDKMLKGAVDEIVLLRARIAELKAALKPFADEADGLWDDEADDEIYDMTVKPGDLRAARAAYLGEKEPAPPNPS